MAYIDPRYLEHQRKRFMRHDAQLYIRHDAYRVAPPGWPRYVGEEVVRYFWPEVSGNLGQLAAPSEDREEVRAVEQERRAIEWNMAALRLQRAWLQIGLQ
jgi:hypothetical protein